MGTDVKSKPCYQSIDIDPVTSCDLFVGESGRSGKMMELFEQSDANNKLSLNLSLRDWATEAANKQPPHSLVQVLSELPMTSKIYLFGSEAFMWDVHNFALNAGFVSEQIRLHEPTSSVRRVFCTHCYGVMEDVSVTPVTCKGCGLLLLVRDHFSRHHGAYVGLNINAEDPSEQFEEEVL